jgi:hypothetical protein
VLWRRVNYGTTNNIDTLYLCLVMENLVQAFLQTSGTCRLNQRDMRDTAYSCGSTPLEFSQPNTNTHKALKIKRKTTGRTIYIERPLTTAKLLFPPLYQLKAQTLHTPQAKQNTNSWT